MPRVHTLHLSHETSGWIADGAPATAVAAAEGAAEDAAGTDDGEAAASAASAPVATREVPMARAADISAAGVYLLDGVLDTTLWIGAQAAPTFVAALFGDGVPRDGAALLPAEANEEARKLHALLEQVREGRPGGGAPLRVLVQGSAESPRFFSRLLADGYEPFALAMHGARVKPKL